MEEQIKQFGFPAIFIVMVTKMIFDLLGKRKTEEPEMPCHERCEILDGVLAKLSENMLRQTTILQRLEEDSREMVRGMQRVETKVDGLH